MTIFEWPTSLVPHNISIRPPRKTLGLTTSLTEFTQAVPAIRAPFGMTLEFDALFGDDVLAYRTLLALLEGRANAVRVPMFDMWFAATGAQISYGLVGHSDGTSFSDGALYLTDDLAGVLVTAVQGARYITADFGAYGQILQAGQYFGLGDQPYIATSVKWTGTVAEIRCAPTLRQDYTAQPLRLRPVMIGRLTGDDVGEHALKSMRSTTPTLDFVETFNGPLS
ncbi:hypothetical protein J2X73_002546 [Novosphingobium sp. 1748]|uniref:hypothetical protein n=1 Tax=Novosphingobium sp. 1748 TaxID=2817760 RepID=UPI002858B1D3|nr:hypothetical protein [Novosphingobium sp. 1748]MDR6708175.1 hypothetical protein [Novosphingobium sp. 1748]